MHDNMQVAQGILQYHCFFLMSMKTGQTGVKICAQSQGSEQMLVISTVLLCWANNCEDLRLLPPVPHI